MVGIRSQKVWIFKQGEAEVLWEGSKGLNLELLSLAFYIVEWLTGLFVCSDPQNMKFCPVHYNRAELFPKSMLYSSLRVLMLGSENLLKAVGTSAEKTRELLPLYKHQRQQANILLIKILGARETLITPQHPGPSKCRAWTLCGLASRSIKDCGLMGKKYKRSRLPTRTMLCDGWRGEMPILLHLKTHAFRSWLYLSNWDKVTID